MKTIKIEETSITQDKIKFQGDKDKKLNYKDLIDMALDIVPQGGFTPKDIKERNRIQDALDSSTNTSITLEDSDFEALERIITDSRWTIRNSDLNIFLKKFEYGDFKTDKKKV